MTTGTGSLRRQRVDLASPPLLVEIDHGAGMAAFAGDAQVAALRDTPATAARWAPIPDLTSLLSAEPAVLYRCGDLAIPLTVAEYAALVGGELTAAEIGKLTLVFGAAWEWGDAFYARETLRPLRPHGLRERMLGLAPSLA